MSNLALYSAEVFTEVNLQLILHPERNTKHIRRADILNDSETDPYNLNNDHEGTWGMTCTRTIGRRLMPRNPNFDSELEQTCRFYALEGEDEATVVTYHNHFVEGEKLPYYVPGVLGIAFELFEGIVYLSYLPVPNTSSEDDRLQRTALHLLQTLHRHWFPPLSTYVDGSLGTQEGYQKRVHHDLIVSKSSFQDLYIHLKNKYAKDLINAWVEATDPKKHVFEDISLTAFLILLWEQDRGRETKFVDIGCGNGVLVYLLTMERYEGYGFDARRRKSWDIFPPNVQERLYERVLVPHFLTDDVTGKTIHNGNFDEGTFLISNHADELTPYTPLLAALTPSSSGFLAIPCCEHDFSGSKSGGGSLSSSIANISKGGGGGRYGVYCEWIGEISREMGWTIEREMLRIPSTRNVGIIGRKLNTPDDGKDRELALEVIRKLGGQNGVQGFVDRALGLKEKVHRGH